MSPLISPLSPSISLYLPSSSSISLYVLYPPPFPVSSVISLYLLPFPLIRPLSTRLAGMGKLCEAFEPKFAALPMKGRQWALPFEPGLKRSSFLGSAIVKTTKRSSLCAHKKASPETLLDAERARGSTRGSTRTCVSCTSMKSPLPFQPRVALPMGDRKRPHLVNLD